MFEEFYNFANTPFSRTIPTKNLYRGNDSDELIERLKYTATRQLFALMIGDSGTGKTTTLRRFCDETHDQHYVTMYLSDSRLTPRTFYKSLLEQLGFEPKYQRNRELFTDAAVDEIFNFSGGIPRLINKAGTESRLTVGQYMYGAQNRKSIIDDRMVKLVIE